MGEKELFNFGDKDLNINSLLNNITSNLLSYADYYSNSITDSKQFFEKVDYIKNGIKNGSITTNGLGVYYDTNGKLSKDDKLMNNALHYVDIIAKEQSKKERSLTKSEIAKQLEEKMLKKAEVDRQKEEYEKLQKEIKPDFTPQDGWSVAKSFAGSFNQNGQIPYDLLQQLVTVDDEGKEIYTDLYKQLDKNFDYISNQLNKFNGTESYINNINLFKNALKDGELSPLDRFLGMELGFQNSELDKLNALIKYKVKPKNTESTETPVVSELTPVQEIPELKQEPLERDDVYLERVEKYKQEIQALKDLTTKFINSIKFDEFNSPKSIKSDSEKEFEDYLVKYINNYLLKTKHKDFVRMRLIRSFGSEFYEVPMLTKEFDKKQIQYIDPKLYNELGLKFFSKYTTTKMYKHFKNLVDKQNQTEVSKHDKGGILKAQDGVKTPWRRNFNGSTHQIDNIYKLFTDNILSYDAKLIANALNKLGGDKYKSLNFGGTDNSLGFKDWNATFNESGLNSLFGYNEDKSDYLGVTTRSRNNFVNNLKNKGNITTGNGTLSFNSANNKWEYVDWVDSNDNDVKTITEGSQSNVEDPGVTDLTLKDVNLRKPTNLNPNGIINSLVGYVANESANKKKHEIQKEIPVYLEVAAPEKAFKTAYTYDLEKAKNEIMAEANNIQPLTSDVNAYYAARNEAIKNARAYSTKLDTEINDRVHQVVNDNKDIAFENAARRVENVNTNAKHRHDWVVEQKLGDVDFIEAANKSFQNLNKEFKHYAVTDATKKEKTTDVYVAKHLLTGLTTNPSNYINGWTKHHDLIWYKGLNNQLETDQERIEYQQLQSLVNQASSNILAKYENISYPGIGILHTNDAITEGYNPNKHGVTVKGSKGMKIDKLKIGNFINKLK